MRSLFLRARRAAILISIASMLPACASSNAAGAPAPDRWWPSYGANYANTRHVDLADITPRNVSSLKLAWKFTTGVTGQFETSPVVVDGRLYFTTGSDNGVYALDAANGSLIWHFVPKVGRARYIFQVNRGVAVDSGRVYYTTLDDQLIALDARTGKLVWNQRIGDPRTGLSEDAAPLVWNGLVFVGSAGNEYGVRGSFSAYSQTDGKLAWRWYAVSAGWEGAFTAAVHGYSLNRNIARERATAGAHRDAWRTGGGAVWMTPALSPTDATIYLSTGNPAPAFHGDERPGDNLYTECIVALDARSGKMKWYYQETPHDVWDYDAASPPVLVDVRDAAGRRIPAVAEAAKTGWLYIVDRRSGRLVRLSQPVIPQPHLYAALTAARTAVEPGDVGGVMGPIAYDPGTHAAFVAGNIDPEFGQTTDLPPWRAAGDAQWEGGTMTETGDHSSRLSSVDVDTGRIRWSTPIPNLIYGGPLSMNGLVFLGETATGSLKAFDAADGKVLWNVVPGETVLSRFDAADRATHFVAATKKLAVNLWHRVRHVADYGDEDIHAPPVAYRMNGRAYLVVATNDFGSTAHAGGDTIFAFALP